MFNGDQEWYQNNQLHRDSHFPDRENDLPAVSYVNGRQQWYQHGLLHRDHISERNSDDPPAIICASSQGYKYGKHHRDNDLPAVICTDGSQEWWQHGKLHRDNGLPARIYANGYAEWWINNGQVSQKYLIIVF